MSIDADSTREARACYEPVLLQDLQVVSSVSGVDHHGFVEGVQVVLGAEHLQARFGNRRGPVVHVVVRGVEERSKLTVRVLGLEEVVRIRWHPPSHNGARGGDVYFG